MWPDIQNSENIGVLPLVGYTKPSMLSAPRHAPRPHPGTRSCPPPKHVHLGYHIPSIPCTFPAGSPTGGTRPVLEGSHKT